MKTAIRYFTTTGNTKKLADAISDATGATAETLDVPLTERVDVLFLGSSVYAFGVDESVKRFIAELDPEMVGRVVCFSTAALVKSTYSKVSKLLTARGITVDKREFHCKGQFKSAHKGRPNAEDLSAVKAFAAAITAE